VYSRDLRWKPIGEQSANFTSDDIGPVDEDILIAKLAPSQRIDATLHARKGIGKDHAKFSPVAGCFYRHLTTFDFADDEELTEEEIEKLKTCFPKGHLKFLDDKHHEMRIVNPRLDTSSDLTFMSCPSLKKKLLITTHDDVLTCEYFNSKNCLFCCVLL